MAEHIVIVEGKSVGGIKGHSIKFECRDTTQRWYNGATEVTIESPDLFKHIQRKLGDAEPDRVKIELIYLSIG